MSALAPLSPAQLAAIGDPAALLAHAWALEPGLRMAERAATLDRLRDVLDSGLAPEPPPGRSWRLEMLAERAIDATIAVDLDGAEALADGVLRDAAPSDAIAVARALLASGRALAWRGTEASTQRADRLLVQAAERFAVLGHDEWLGGVTYWRGYAIFFQNGEIRRGITLMREALGILGNDSPRRATVLSFLGDALATVGETAEAEAMLAEAVTLADRDDDPKSRAYASWSRARIASQDGDALLAERLVREVERDGADWFDLYTGVSFLADAAEMLDRVGLDELAGAYLERARERDPDHEFVHLARAALVARSGDPLDGLGALQALAEGEWLEKRLMWRYTLLAAWATFRGGREGAGELAARALEQAERSGGPRVARTGEAELCTALAPLAQRGGSVAANALLLDGRPLLVRLFGAVEVVRADGSEVTLPAGRPAELVRMLAVADRALPVEVVLEAFFPDAAPAQGRQRLRQILTRLRASAGEVVVRDGDALRLVDAWVDVRAFLTASDRARGARGVRAIRHAYAALALHDGEPLEADRYAEWAWEIRGQIEIRHLELLDLVAGDAAVRGSHEEALTALDAGRSRDPGDPRRDAMHAAALRALGRRVPPPRGQ